MYHFSIFATIDTFLVHHQKRPKRYTMTRQNTAHPTHNADTPSDNFPDWYKDDIIDRLSESVRHKPRYCPVCVHRFTGEPHIQYQKYETHCTEENNHECDKDIKWLDLIPLSEFTRMRQRETSDEDGGPSRQRMRLPDDPETVDMSAPDLEEDSEDDEEGATKGPSPCTHGDLEEEESDDDDSEDDDEDDEVVRRAASGIFTLL